MRQGTIRDTWIKGRDRSGRRRLGEPNGARRQGFQGAGNRAQHKKMRRCV